MNNFMKTFDDLIAAEKKLVVVSSFNCEVRPVHMNSDTIDSNAKFIMIDSINRGDQYN